MRRTPLRRKTRLRARGKTKHARRPRDMEYMGKVAALRTCVVRELAGHHVGCEGRLEVDHATGRYGEDSDRNTIPLCRKHHAEKTGQVGGGGFMAGKSLAWRRGWLAMAIAWTRAAVEGVA